MERTNWERYYQHAFFAARFTRAVVLHELIRCFRQTGVRPDSRIMEFGGAGSFCAKKLMETFHPANYTAVDNCLPALQKLKDELPEVRTIPVNLLSAEAEKLPEADLVFSVGLIEHFSPEETARLIQLHFDKTRPGGFVVLFYPTPVLTYRFFRRTAEILNLWKFPDERPIRFPEIEELLRRNGTVIRRKVIYGNVFAQDSVIIRRREF